jgi:hypothetical protein
VPIASSISLQTVSCFPLKTQSRSGPVVELPSGNVFSIGPCQPLSGRDASQREAVRRPSSLFLALQFQTHPSAPPHPVPLQ